MMWIDSLVRNVRHAVRSLARVPGFTIAAVLTLALGIGANTAVFSVVRSVILRPLPFPDGDRLVHLSQTHAKSRETNIAPVRLENWQRLNVTFDAISGYYAEDVTDTSRDLPDIVRRAIVAPRFLDVWKVTPRLGRPFSESEYRTGGPAAVVISDRYWRTRMGADPGVLNRTVRIGEALFAIVGVMPREFPFPDAAVDLWFPSAVDDRGAQSRGAAWFTGIGRLKRGITLAKARSDLDGVQAQLGAQFPEFDRDLRVQVVSMKETVAGTVRESLWLLFGGVSVLLLIACANVAGLLLARATHRQQGIAVRYALGGSRLAVAGEMLVESAGVTLAGAAIGLLVAVGGIAILRTAAPGLPRLNEISVDWSIALYTFASAIVVALVCGVVPVVRVTRGDLARSVSAGGRAEVSRHGSLQWLLVGVQVALSVTLLMGTGLLLRSLLEISRVDAGFDRTHVLAFRISGHFAEMANYAGVVSRVEGTIAALSALPGVDAVATTTLLPGLPASFESSFQLVEGGDGVITAASRVVSPEYFDAMQIPVVQGELCRRQPRGAAPGLMVNRSFAARHLSGRASPLGLRLAPADAAPRAIVGVVGDTREGGLDKGPSPTVYTCSSVPNPMPHFLVRTTGDPRLVVDAIRRKVKELQPLRSVYDIAPLEQKLDGAFGQDRLRAALLGGFGLVALALACVGLYGTVSYVVGARRKEIGQRLALGAPRGTIVRHFVWQALRVVGGATAVGLLLSYGAARLFAGMVVGVSTTDPLVLSTVVATVLTVGALAASIPAVRGALVDPMRALRE